MMKNKRFKYIAGFAAAVVLCSASCGTAEITREKETVDFKEYFEHYDEMMGNDMLSTGYTSYDVREMESQIDGFWDYYERYEKAQQDLDQTIEEWDADFIGEGTYIAGSDIRAGKYVFCNPDGDNNDDKNAVSTSNKKNTSYADIFTSPHFSVITLQKDDVLKVKGNPKLAPLDQFPEFSVSEDGCYYGRYYEVGRNIPEGMYLVLSMDTKKGKISCGGNAEAPGGSHIGAPRTRFRYMILADHEDDKKDSYLESDNCVLIPAENKPAINPIPHEDIAYKNKAATAADLLAVLLGKEEETERDYYSQPVYAQGECIIGEDLSLGTYQIQCEIAGVISDRDSREYQSDYICVNSGVNDYSWSGLSVYYQDMAEQCGWKYIRLGRWEGGKQRVGIKDPDGNMSGYTVYEEELPCVTFTEKDKGVAVSVIRAILIPVQESPGWKGGDVYCICKTKNKEGCRIG